MTQLSETAAPDLKDISLEDILAFLIPRGFPTFDEFRRNPDKYRTRPEEILEHADGSTDIFRKALLTQKYFWRDQVDCGKSLEKIERICKEEGFSLMDLEMQPIVKPQNGTSKDGDVVIEVHFWPKSEFRARGGVVANDG